MSETTITNLPSAGPLSGSELLETVQASASYKVSAQRIANLAPIQNHNVLTGLLGDGHPQYMPVDASRSFSAPVSGQDPTLNEHLTTKTYVDIIPSATQEPTGFVKRSDSTLSFSDITQELSLTSLTGQTAYFIHGKKYTFSGTKTASAAGSGSNFFYLDENGDMNVIQTFDSELLLRDSAYVAVVYWDAVNSKHIYLGDERHGILWDWNHHRYEHFIEGTVWKEGLGLANVTAYPTVENIHDGNDNDYWDGTTIQTFAADFDFSSTDQNNTPGGSQSIDYTDSEDGDIAQFTRPEGDIDLTPFISLMGYIYLTSTLTGGDDIMLYGWDTGTGTMVGNTIDLTDYITTGLTDTWQSFTIPLVDMGLDGETIDAIRMEMVGVGADPNGYVDDLQLFPAGGDLNSDLTFGVGSGIIYDEDLQHDISEIIKGSASYYVFYREGPNGMWTSSDVTSAAVLSTGSGRLAYNAVSGSTWYQEEAPDDSYVMSFIFAINDANRNIISVQAQTYYDTIEGVRAGVVEDILNILTGDMPFQEFSPIATLIYNTNDLFTNDYKAKIVYVDSGNTESWQDFRKLESASTGSANITNHSNLSGLANPNAHPQYTLVNGSRDFTGPVGGIDPVASDDLSTKNYVDTQDALLMPIDGSESFSAPVSGQTPTKDEHLTTKGYVDTQDNLLIPIDGSKSFSAPVSGQTPVKDIHLATKGYVDTQTTKEWTYTPVIAVSGTNITLTDQIPSAALEIEIFFNGVSTSASNQPPIIRVGDAGGIEAAGYVGVIRGPAGEDNVTAGLYTLRASDFLAANIVYGRMRLARWDASLNLWFIDGLFDDTSDWASYSGRKTTSQPLSTIELTTPGGAVVLDAGSARVRWR